MEKFKSNIPLLLIVLVVGLVFSVLILKPSWVIGGDGFGYYSYARSVFFDGDIDMENEFVIFDKYFRHKTLTFWRTPIYKAGNPFAVGASILWSPFIGTAYALDSFFDFKDSPYRQGLSFELPGYSLPYQIAVGLGTWVYTLAGIALVFAGLRKLFTSLTSFLAILTTFAVSPLPFYLIYEPSMAHGLTVFTTGILFFVSLRFLYHRRERFETLSYRYAIIFSVATGLAFLVRWQDILFGIIPLGVFIIYYLSFFHGREKMVNRSLLVALGGTLSFFVIILPQLLTWKYLYGSFIAVPQGSRFFDLSSPHFLDFLFSGHHGMFALHPVLILGVVGLGIAFRKNSNKNSHSEHGEGSQRVDPALEILRRSAPQDIKKIRLLILLLLLTLALQIYLNAGLSDWYGGGSFGARRMVSAFFIFAFGFASLFSFLSKKKILASIVGIIVIVGFVFNGILMVSYARGIIPLNKPTTLVEVYSAPQILIKTLIFR